MNQNQNTDNTAGAVASAAPCSESSSREKLKISIDRGARKWAVFKDEFTLIRDFEGYTNEADALEGAKAWCRGYGDESPSVVYPQITSMRITRKRR
jgi:hypothetical protein